MNASGCGGSVLVARGIRGEQTLPNEYGRAVATGGGCTAGQTRGHGHAPCLASACLVSACFLSACLVSDGCLESICLANAASPNDRTHAPCLASVSVNDASLAIESVAQNEATENHVSESGRGREDREDTTLLSVAIKCK